MYKCAHCGKLFDDGEEKTYKESVGEYFGFPSLVSYACCPFCGEDDYEEISACKICGSYDHDVDEVYCKDCEIDVMKRFAAIVRAEFSSEERELLKELYENDELGGRL
jgi:hypothetical protein